MLPSSKNASAALADTGLHSGLQFAMRKFSSWFRQFFRDGALGRRAVRIFRRRSIYRGWVAERGENIVRDNFGIIGASSGRLVPVRSDFQSGATVTPRREVLILWGRTGRSGEI